MSFRTSPDEAPAASSTLASPPQADPVYSLQRRVRSYDVGPDHRLTVPGLLRQLHDTAQSHAGAHEFGYGQLAERGLAWALVCIDLRFLGPSPRGETDFEAATSVRRAAGPVVMRDYVASAVGEPFAIGQTMWALIDLDTRATATTPQAMRALLNDIATPLLDAPTVRRLRDEGPFGKTSERRVYLHDCDFNGHLNNVVAVQMMLDAVADIMRSEQDRGIEALPVSRLRVSYHSEALVGEVLGVGVATAAASTELAIESTETLLDVELRGGDGRLVANAVVHIAARVPVQVALASGHRDSRPAHDTPN